MQRFVEELLIFKNRGKKAAKTEEIVSEENSVSMLQYKTEDPMLPDAS